MQNLTTSKTKLEMSVLSKFNPTEQKILELKSLGNVRFGDMTNEQKQGLAKSLVKLSYFVGIKEPLSIDNLKMLVYYLANQHPAFTQEELEQAFFMASSGEFGEIEHYQTFSPAYVSKIIKAYLSKRSEASVKYHAKLQKQQAEEESNMKARQYNPVEGCVDALCAQYDTYLRYDEIVSDTDKFPYEEMRASIAIQMAQKLSLFKDYDSSKESAFDFFKRIYDKVPRDKSVDETKKVIAEWVRVKSIIQ